MKIRYNTIDIIKNVLCIILLTGIVIYLIIRWNHIPDQVPGHFDGSGQVTRWDNKGTLWVLPAIGWFLFIGMSILEQFPKIWNTGVRITEENMYRVYRVLKNLLGSIKLLISALFVSISVIQSLVISLPVWYIVIFLALIFITLIFNMIRLFKVK